MKSDAYFDLREDGLEAPGEYVPNENRNLARLRERASRTEAAEAETAALTRERAFLRTEGRHGSKLGSLMRTFEGEVTEEALGTEAAELGNPSPRSCIAITGKKRKRQPQ